MNVQNILFMIIRQIALEDHNCICNDITCDYSKLYKLAKQHDLAHLLLPSIKNKNDGIDVEFLKKIQKTNDIAIYRSVRQEYVYKKICKIFSENKIRYIPLKGILICKYYPEKWMRTSCDIDILVHDEEIDKAVKVLERNGFKTTHERNYHDISLFFDNIHIELHFNICEDMKKLDSYLKCVWKYSRQFNECEYHMDNEFFIFYHVAHMCYHFVSGGCGIRSFIDLYLIKKHLDYDEKKLFYLLEQTDLKLFYKAVCDLMEVWFGNSKHNEITHFMEKYIISGGIYGTTENFSVISSVYYKGKLRNMIRIVFPNYFTMCNLYPFLNKCKIALPFCYFIRIFNKLKTSRKRVTKKMKSIAFMDKDKTKDLDLFMKEIGLNK